MITAACALLDGTGSQDRCARAVFTRAYTLFDFWELREITPEASNPHPQLVNFGLKSKTRACREPPKSNKRRDFALALRPNSAYVSCMSFCSKAFSLALAIALCACGAEQALARSKKQTADPPVPIITMDDSGTPIIMQGLAIERARKRPGAADEGQPKPRAERPIKIPRGSSAYVPPPVPSPSGGPPSPILLRPQVTPYQPPAINSFSDRVIGCNQSFTFNAGIGNNPTNRDAYVRSCAN